MLILVKQRFILLLAFFLNKKLELSSIIDLDYEEKFVNLKLNFGNVGLRIIVYLIYY